MINLTHFRTMVVRPTLERLGMHSPAAENLMMGTALAESHLCMLRQAGGGPARGLYQMEPATAIDLTRRYLDLRPELQARFEAALRSFTPADVVWDAVDDAVLSWRLVSDLGFATAMCRLRYWIVPEPLPPPGDVTGLGGYWKQHYNTPLGAGTVEHFTTIYRRHFP